MTKRLQPRSRGVTRLATALLALAAVAVAAGCGGDDETITDPEPLGPLVVYERAGGIAYTAQRMEIDEGGAATVVVEGPGEIGAEFELTDAELEELRELLAGADLERPSEGPTGCADCYVYRIEAEGDTASFDQTNYPPGTEPLVAFLSDLVERETPTGPARGG